MFLSAPLPLPIDDEHETRILSITGIRFIVRRKHGKEKILGPKINLSNEIHVL